MSQRADPLHRSIPVKIPADLSQDLLDLISGTGHDDHHLGPALTELVDAVHTAIPSYRGMRITITTHGHTMHIDAFPPPEYHTPPKTPPETPAETPAATPAATPSATRSGSPDQRTQEQGQIMTSLRVPLTILLPVDPTTVNSDITGHIVFYAATPGAFVDLAADLRYALGSPAATNIAEPHIDQSDTLGADRQVTIELDNDLPPPTQLSGVAGLDEASTINRAVGMLIAEGHPPHQALTTLHQQATAAGVAPHIYAARLLRR